MFHQAAEWHIQYEVRFQGYRREHSHFPLLFGVLMLAAFSDGVEMME